ncbi:Hypothetical protein SRAE_X000159400 [Strongyloides ratti]|uniref:Uncharacterized protein n=1 Tax=Strongyloides ratti TaxID=34506 RepID=A0A090KVF6_STRRB|nr:Hypothetical protein SRAE_X000159400 [Strongyloides ratti]CEF59850.1 Hypothetical protein SRAE_X000159400 [Strongyloides ratti]
MNKEEDKKLIFGKKSFSIGRSQIKERYKSQIKENTDKNSLIGRSKSVTFLNSKHISKEVDNNIKEPKIYKARSAIKSLNSLIVAVERSRLKNFEKDFINKHQSSFDSNSDSEEEDKYQINSEILRKLRVFDSIWLNTTNKNNPETFINLKQFKKFQRPDYDKTVIETITCKNKPGNIDRSKYVRKDN